MAISFTYLILIYVGLFILLYKFSFAYIFKQTLLDAQLPYTAKITTKNQNLFFLNAFGWNHQKYFTRYFTWTTLVASTLKIHLTSCA